MLPETQDEPTNVAPRPVDEPMRDEPRRIATGSWVLALVALTCVTFGSIVRHDFVNFDDDTLIRDNADFRPVTFKKTVDYWGGPYYGGAFPVTYTVLALIADSSQDAKGNIQPGLFHAVSVALHAACTVLVFLLLRALVRRDTAAALGAALFCVHPLQVESVAWATNINTLLYGVFSLLALWLYVLYAQRRPHAKLLFAAATVAFVLAMLSKPVAVALPLVAAALDVGFVRRRWRDVIWPTVLWLVLALPVMVLTRVMLDAPTVFVPPLWARPLVAMDALAFYLAKLVAPISLNVDYGRTPKWLMSSPALYLTWLAPIAVAVVVFWYRRRAPELLAAAVIFVVALAPVLGLTPFHYQQYSTVANRYVYISMFGVALALAWALVRLPRTATVCAAILVAVFTLWTRIEIRQWRDSDTLFETYVWRNPTSLAAHNVLGFSAKGRREWDVSMAHYLAALRTDPAHTTANFNLANLLRSRGRPGEAIPYYRTALVRAPRDIRFHNNLAVALAESGQHEAAVESFQNAQGQLEVHRSNDRPRHRESGDGTVQRIGQVVPRSAGHQSELNDGARRAGTHARENERGCDAPGNAPRALRVSPPPL